MELAENTGRKKSIKSRHLCTIYRTTLSGYVFATGANYKSLFTDLFLKICWTAMPHVLTIWWTSTLAAEIGLLVWGTPANFNGFRVLAALLHGTLVVSVSQTLRCWTEGATYIPQGGHHVGNWPTF